MAGGALAYCATMAAGFTLFGLHQIVIGISVSLILMIAGSLLSKPDEDPDMHAVFFPE